jgi:hypothetical protein
MPVIRANVVDLAPGFMLGEIIPFHDVLDIMKLSRDELVAAVTVPAGKKGKTAEKAKKLELIEEMAKRFVISYADWSTRTLVAIAANEKSWPLVANQVKL